MAEVVLCATQAWGVIQDRKGDAQAGVPVTFDTTVYQDAEGTIPWAGTPVTDDSGRIPGYVPIGALTVSYNGQEFAVEAYSGGVEAAFDGRLGSVETSVAGKADQADLDALDTATAKLAVANTLTQPLTVQPAADTAKALLVGKDVAWNTPARDASLLSVARTVGTDDLDEWGMTSRLVINDYTASGTHAKGAILALVLNKSSSADGHARDGVPVYGQGWIDAGQTSGRAHGLVGEARHVDNTADGLLFGAELGVFNEGTLVTNPDDTKAKIGAWIVSRGSQRATAMIATGNNSAAWHYAAFLRQFTVGIRLQSPGTAGAIGIDMTNNANWGVAIQMPNGKSLRGYKADGSAALDIALLNTSDQAVVGNNTPLIISSGSGSLGFFGHTPAAKQTVTGSKGSNAALTSLLAALVAHGLITDTTT